MFDFFVNPLLAGQDLSLGIFGSLFGIAGSVIGAFGKRKAGRAQQQAANLNARQVEERAQIETTLRERAGIREVGQIATAAGASGLAGGGSAADILAESARNTAFDLATIRTQSELEARVLRLGGKAARTAGNIGFASGLLGAADQAVSSIQSGLLGGIK